MPLGVRMGLFVYGRRRIHKNIKKKKKTPYLNEEQLNFKDSQRQLLKQWLTNLLTHAQVISKHSIPTTNTRVPFLTLRKDLHDFYYSPSP